jgi:hypothetical protein
MKRLSILVLLLVLCAAGALRSQVIYIPPHTATINSLSLGSPSFTGGAADGTTVGAITVTTSNGTTPTLALTGTTTGTGNDKDSFRISGTNLLTNTVGGATDQPGQYSICVTATGSYTNSPQQACATVQATGPGGAGWDLTFIDQFATAKGPAGTYMLNWQNQQSPTSITWGTSGGFCAAGCAQVVLASPSGWSPNLRAGNTVSLVGATNTGSGNINTNFQVFSVTDDKDFLIYMPGTSAVWGTIGVSGATIGTGPWVGSIVASAASPQSNPTMEYTNNLTEGWAAENDTVDANGLSILTQNTSYTSADGVSHTYKSGHVQTWNGNAGFAQSLGNGYALDFYGEPLVSGTPTGLWVTFWALGSDNSWPGSSGAGGEIDVAEFGIKQCPMTEYDVNNFGGGALNGTSSPPLTSTGTFIGTNHQFTSQVISGGSISYYLDGSAANTNDGLNGSYTGWQPTDAIYPLVDVEYPTSGCGAGATLPATARMQYVRVYSKVTSNACYSSIPAHGTVPHTGSC